MILFFRGSMYIAYDTVGMYGGSTMEYRIENI